MKTEYLTDYSPALGRDMECMVYGHAGRPVLYIPCQDGRFFDFGDFHMAETLACRGAGQVHRMRASGGIGRLARFRF